MSNVSCGDCNFLCDKDQCHWHDALSCQGQAPCAPGLAFRDQDPAPKMVPEMGGPSWSHAKLSTCWRTSSGAGPATTTAELALISVTQACRYCDLQTVRPGREPWSTSVQLAQQ